MKLEKLLKEIRSGSEDPMAMFHKTNARKWKQQVEHLLEFKFWIQAFVESGSINPKKGQAILRTLDRMTKHTEASAEWASRGI